jgi:hypothetical protein
MKLCLDLAAKKQTAPSNPLLYLGNSCLHVLMASDG